MPSPDAPPEVTELIYVPEPSWRPALVAVGLAAMIAAIFMGWFYALAGGIIFIAGLWGWIRQASDNTQRLPRRQELTSAVIPATPMRRSGRSARQPDA
jgi:hypothetical protein